MIRNNSNKTSTKEQKIELRELNLYVASHQFWVRYDENGKVIGEIHGFAVDDNGQPMQISFGGTPIKVFHYAGKSGYYMGDQSAKSMLEGPSDFIAKRWSDAVKACDEINDLKLQYKLATCNSNSVARTVGDIMGFEPQNISGRSVMGQDTNLLPKTKYASLYHDFNSTAVSNLGVKFAKLSTENTQKKDMQDLLNTYLKAHDDVIANNPNLGEEAIKAMVKTAMGGEAFNDVTEYLG